MPVDTSKVRLQLQGLILADSHNNISIKYRGMLHTMYMIATEEGSRSLWKGLSAALQRQFIFAGLRIGLYPSIRDTIVGKNNNPTLPLRALSGFISGAVGIIVASPCDVLKVRMQADRRKLNAKPLYKNTIHAYQTIIEKEGFKGLYAGIVPNIVRCAVMNSVELASYDQAKTYFVKTYKIHPATTSLHLSCAVIASFFAILLASPVDLMKTRMMSVINSFNSFRTQINTEES